MKTLTKRPETDSTATVIHANVFDPFGSVLFKTKATDRAECQTITCTNLECPLLAKGQCHIRGGLFGNTCPYGTSRRESGPTKRAAGCSSWVREKREQHKGVRFLQPASNQMAIIGDYVFLPYAHMTMCQTVPFKSRSGFFSSGDAFLPREVWTIETVLELLKHRPQAVMGGEITCYQKEEVPKFLLHLREADPEMWKQLIAVCPQYDVQANHVGRQAVLQTLKHPIKWTQTSSRGEYPVHWEWDGETVTTTSKNVFNTTWAGLEAESLEVKVKPKPRTVIVVKSNDWVDANTEFVT